MYNTNSQIKFKTSVFKSNLCDFSNVYILASGTITVRGHEDERAEERNKKVIF